MKPHRPWLVPLSLVICVILVIGAMAWITLGTLAAERERAGAEMRAVIQERTRLALWRMDSLGASLLLEESGFPEGASRLPVKLRFAVFDDGELRIAGHGSDPAGLTKTLHGKVLEVMCGITQTQSASTRQIQMPEQREGAEAHAYERYAPLDPAVQKLASQNEQIMRSKAVRSTVDLNNSWRNRPGRAVAGNDRVFSDSGRLAPAPTAAQDTMMSAPAADEPAMAEAMKQAIVDEAGVGDLFAERIVGPPRAAWVDGMLVMARRVAGPEPNQVFDGALVDDNALRALLLAEGRDLLWNASLVDAGDRGDDGMVLASFPYRLVVPAPDPSILRIRNSTLASLWMSWAAALVALIAISCLVRGVIVLSERRASFVSAVTHELRTPLTTFRLYSDMLGGDVVREERRREYLGVLSREADRLEHLVENVLAFSRIERGNAKSQIRIFRLSEFLDEIRERMEMRLSVAGLHLAIDVPAELAVRADRVAVEHIILNLIDNAAKYAASGGTPVVTIHAAAGPGSAVIRVCDHGPGIPIKEMRRIFRPFHKSAREAAESKPGVGLGLALSRRLARQQGGDLTCVPRDHGSCFQLKIPRA